MGVLSPVPFERLVARAFEELSREERIYDLPARKFFTGDARHDTSVPIHGRTAAAPLGPSAGPHTQMAQNIVLAWLGGARVFELKTVQRLDELTIPRPCIDVRTVALNVEWSQELKLEQSLEEYVKASMLIEMLIASKAVGLAPGFDRHLFDMSVGYDLDGIRSERMVAFMRGLLDARETVDRLRAQVPEKWRHLRDLDFTTRIAPSVTVSTFHGCPVQDIERIADFLMTEMGLDCSLKLNPTLLGEAEVQSIVRDRLGYSDVTVPGHAYVDEPTWEEAVGIVERMRVRARTLGRSFGVKLTNTLVVENHSAFLPATEKFAYLSGPPLHVVAMRLAARFRGAFGATLPISFSAGIDRLNYPDAVRLGLAPVTVCTDLLKQGGYGRLEAYGRELASRMEAAGARTIDEFRTGTFDDYLATVESNPRYHAASAAKRRRTGQRIFIDDCSMCDLCIPACPNNAIFPIAPLETSKDHPHQIAVLVDLCNDCGNCEVFCPDGGAPNREKYRVTLQGYARGALSGVIPSVSEGSGRRGGTRQEPQALDSTLRTTRPPGSLAHARDDTNEVGVPTDEKHADYLSRAISHPSHVNYLNCLSLEETS